MLKVLSRIQNCVSERGQSRRGYGSSLPVVIAVAFVSLILLGPSAPAKHGQAAYVAHEWGTFTSVQGGDGALVPWKPLESSHLPGFVYNWQNPGLGRLPAGDLAFSKVQLMALQRIETPVIYFYAGSPATVDVSVKFPQGLITEWYPQASRIGPSSTKPPWAAAKLDEFVHNAGLKPGFTLASILSKASATPDSGARWGRVNILPKASQTGQLPTDASGSHYFEARGTDANPLEVILPSNAPSEREKFLFYRGVGNFETPLRASAGKDGVITIQNTGKEAFSDLFVLRLENDTGAYAHVESVAPGQQRAVCVERKDAWASVGQVSKELGTALEHALVKHGLYPKEASAMVRTWKGSWFQEDGLRVLYILPRTWIDRTLPMTLRPEPKELARVMVGRAELLLPATEQRLAKELREATSGDDQARINLVADLRRLNRFAEPALQLATEGAQPELKTKGWECLQAAASGTP